MAQQPTKQPAAPTAPKSDKPASPTPAAAPAKKKNNTKTVIIVVSIVVFLFVVLPIIIFAIGAIWLGNQLNENGVNVDTTGGGVSVQDDNGNTFSAGSKTSLPADFPNGVTLYSKDITTAGKATFEGKTTWTVSVQTNDSVATVTSAIKDSFSKDGWSIELESTTSEGSYINSTNGTLSVNAFVGSTDGKTTVVYTVSQVSQ